MHWCTGLCNLRKIEALKRKLPNEFGEGMEVDGDQAQKPPPAKQIRKSFHSLANQMRRFRTDKVFNEIELEAKRNDVDRTEFLGYLLKRSSYNDGERKVALFADKVFKGETLDERKEFNMDECIALLVDGNLTQRSYNHLRKTLPNDKVFLQNYSNMSNYIDERILGGKNMVRTIYEAGQDGAEDGLFCGVLHRVDASVVKYVQRQMEMLVNEEKKPPFGNLEVTFVVGGDTSRRR